MERAKLSSKKFIQGTLSCIMIIVFILFLLGEVVRPEETMEENNPCQILDAEWVRVLPDGTKTVVEIPGECDAQPGEVVTVETRLPDNQEDTWFCIRSMQQEVRVYIDNELRREYSTLATQPFGKTSTMSYVFFEIMEEDAGKTLRLELSSESSYAGYISEIYEGSKDAIISDFTKLYAPSTIVAGFLLLLSFVVVLYSMISRLIYKKEVEISYLGGEIMLASTWLIVESRLRQFIFPNPTIAMYMGFYMIMLLPYPFVAYFNTIQKDRYKKWYMSLQVATIINVILASVLQFLEIKDFFETMTISHVIILALIILATTTIILDVKNGHIAEYKDVAVGLIGMMLSGVVEIYMVYVNSSHYNGIALCLGLVFLLAMAVCKMCRDIIKIEKEKQHAIAESESRAAFLANMSHEIRTPINTVIGMNEMILRENKDAEIKEYASNIKTASRMLLSLINDILDLSKMEAGKLQITESDYHPAVMLKEIIRESKLRTEQKNLELEVVVDETIPTVLQGDIIRIKQVLNNLLSNAVKYTEKGKITFLAKGISEENRFWLELSVKDTGIGIREEDMDTLFDSFQRFDLNRNRFEEGTGLGLSITKQLVENMKGRIMVESEYGKGSCFTVHIPQIVLDDSPMGNPENTVSESNLREEVLKEEQQYPGASVLIVDDNYMNQKVLEGLLKRTRVQMDFAASGFECLDKTKEKTYDLIFMDHMMPKMDGIETLHRLREDKKNNNHDTKIIMLTANAIAGAEESYRKEGFEDYLSKPVEAEKLEGILQKYLKAFGKKTKEKTDEVAAEEPVKAEESVTEEKILIDRSEGLKYCGESEELYQMALDVYVNQAEGFMERLETYLNEKNWSDYATLVHSIKSNSQSIGAMDFYEKSKRQEMAAKAEEESYLKENWESYLAQYKELLEYIKAGVK